MDHTKKQATPYKRKLPQAALDMWRFSTINRKASYLLEPVLHGMCSDLHETYERSFPHMSVLDADGASSESASGVPNDDLDAPHEHQLSPNFPGTVDLPPEHQFTPN
ncbi:unnamed protein product [Urochloa humidicola]